METGARIFEGLWRRDVRCHREKKGDERGLKELKGVPAVTRR
jgi:hypothetical protein